MKDDKQQLDFFSFFNTKEGESHTLEVFDFCSPYIQQKNVYAQEKLEISETTFFFRDEEYWRSISPAHLKVNGKTKEYYPSKREEMVMEVIRYLAAQKLIQSEKDNKETLITVTFRLHELRKELSRTGHGYNWTELSEAIEILSKSTLSVGFNIGKKKAVWSGTYLLNVRTLDDQSDGVGGESIRRVTLHPIASQAIISQAVRLINYERGIRLKSPLARYLYKRFVHLRVNAQAPDLMRGRKAIGLKISIAEAFNAAGLKRNKRAYDDVRVMIKAIEEMKEANLLMSMVHDAYTREGETFTLYPSKDLESEIIRANSANKSKDIQGNFNRISNKN